MGSHWSLDPLHAQLPSSPRNKPLHQSNKMQVCWQDMLADCAHTSLIRVRLFGPTPHATQRVKLLKLARSTMMKPTGNRRLHAVYVSDSSRTSVMCSHLPAPGITASCSIRSWKKCRSASVMCLHTGPILLLKTRLDQVQPTKTAYVPVQNSHHSAAGVLLLVPAARALLVVGASEESASSCLASLIRALT